MIAILAALPLLLAPGQKDVLTPFDVAATRSVTSARIAPDGAHVAYTLAVPRTTEQEDGSSWSELWVLDVEGGRTRPFVSGEVSVRSIEWTPDGAAILFLAKRDGDAETALWSIPIDGGEARRVAKLEVSISGYALAPDGERAALLATEKKSKETEAREKKGYKQEIYEEDWRPTRVWISALGEDPGEPRLLELEGSAIDVAWSPAGDHLAVTSAPTALVDDSYMRKSVLVVAVESGELVARHERPGKLGQVEWSPDGKRLAMIAAQDLHDPSEGRLVIVPALGGDFQDLLPGYPGHVGAVRWKDAGEIMYVADLGVWTVFESVRLDAPGKPRRVFGPEGPILGSLSLAADGQSAAFVGSSPSWPPEVLTMRHGDAAPERRTDSNPWLAGKRLAKQEPIRFRARDGLDLEAVLVHPLERAEGERAPLIVYVHGGPEAHDSNGWTTAYSRPGQVAAAQGFAVAYVNYRGSTGRGVAFSKLSQGDFGGREFDDIVDCVEHLVGTGLADRARVGVTGGSYGGYATAWCSTALSEHFAAGVMFVGISDNVSKEGTSDIPEEMFLVHQRKRPWDDWQFFLERSPIYHAAEGRTPLLILHGKEDPRVDNGQSRELYRHLKQRGQAPVRLVLYPGEGHGNRKRSSRLDYNLRMMRWFEHYLEGSGGEPPAPELDYAEPQDEPVEAGAPSGA